MIPLRSAVLAVPAALLLFCGCEEKIKPSVISSLNGQTLPQQESWNSTIIVSDSGRIHAIIRAGYICVYESSPVTQMSQGVNVRFFNSEGQQTSTLTSEEGSVDEVTNNLEARKNVVVVSSDSSRLKTEDLLWDNRRQLIYTPKNEYVEITTPKEKLQGHGFESDQYLRNYRIFSVTGESRSQ
jgi:LPS export ABC transporter protein LptC